MNIFHITVHLGGGIGRALSDTLTAEMAKHSAMHKIYCLEMPENKHYVNLCLQSGIKVEVMPVSDELYAELSEGDLIIIHWWNHPLTASFLLHFPEDMKTRVLFWIHVSGCTYPYLPFSLIDEMDMTLLTTPYSFHNPLWSPKQQETALKKAAVIYGLGKIQDMPQKQSYQTGEKFIIGYMGTIQESKIHPQIADYCLAVIKRIPSAQFVFAGNNELGNEIMKAFEFHGILGHITFAGYQTDIGTLLTGFDVFGYPLNPYHYGSTENALLEAMSVGLPVVTLDNNAEKYIIQPGYNGLLASSAEDYGNCMESLFQSPKLRERIGTNASLYVRDTFSLEKNVDHFHDMLTKALKLLPRSYDFKRILGNTPAEYFLTCTGKERGFFEKILAGQKKAVKRDSIPDIFKCQSKSSLPQFARYFPDEPFFQNNSAMFS